MSQIDEKRINPSKIYPFKDSEKRAIISIVDFQGNLEKSTFWKWLLDKYCEDIATLSYGTAG